MIAGVDGCRGGWVVAVSEVWPCRSKPRLHLCHDFAAVRKLTGSYEAIAVDIPMGLPRPSERRACDLQARERLGKFGRNRVFFAPPREALDAETPKIFQRTMRRLTGKGVGYPVWAIVPKIKQVDQDLTPKVQGRICEFHPELVWHHLAGRVLQPKKTKDGVGQRLEIILNAGVERVWIDSMTSWRKGSDRAAKVKLDDILDAIVGLAAAADFRNGDLSRRIPSGQPPRDQRGLRMEMWF